MASLTVENYVKAVYQICATQEGRPATTGQLASALGVLPGTVTSMLKTLSQSRLVSYTPYEGVELTDAGRSLALRVLRRHRLIELFLVETLGLTWDEVHEEAEKMEHAVSEFLVDRIDAYLENPQFDPHGDPIPQSDGTVHAAADRSLANCKSGDRFQLSRVADQSPEFLRYLTDAGLQLGTQGRVSENRGIAGMITVEIGGKQKDLSLEAAEKLLVTDPA
jgi:DtxR family Mn-dependent transcriptional regulator